LVAKHTPRGLTIVADVFGTNGALVGHLEDNGFSKMSDNHSRVDREGDLSVLAIYDESFGQIILGFSIAGGSGVTL
jgi:hypothetical protein